MEQYRKFKVMDDRVANKGIRCPKGNLKDHHYYTEQKEGCADYAGIRPSQAPGKLMCPIAALTLGAAPEYPFRESLRVRSGYGSASPW
jgi:hypothetical protein